MANLTISVDGEVLKRARIRALEEDTSVNAVLGGFLKEYARMDDLHRNRRSALDPRRSNKVWKTRKLSSNNGLRA